MAKQRVMSLTPELVALCWRAEEDKGLGDGWTPLTEDEQDTLACHVFSENQGRSLWVFAYGSLIWRPTFQPVETRRATAVGWHRSFCLELLNWRGTPEQPGLMMALDRGGRCDGVAFRLSDLDPLLEVKRMVRREIITKEEMDMVRWIPVQTDAGTERALVFWAGPSGHGISLKLPLEQVAAVLARACGHGGSGAEYLYNTVSHLEEQGIRDRNLWRLHELVAAEIQAIHGAPLAHS